VFIGFADGESAASAKLANYRSASHHVFMGQCRVKLTLWCTVLVLFSFDSSAQVTPVPDDRFWDAQFGVPGVDNNGGVNALIIGSSNLYIGGIFASVGGINATNLSRWDGTSWHEIGGGVGGRPFATVATLLLRNDDLFVGGSFSQAGSIPASNIAKWDGTNWSSLGTGANGSVLTFAALGPYVYIGGNFGSAGGVNTPNIARWDGTNWWPLGSGIRGAGVYTLLAANGYVYAGGNFTNAGSTSATNIARWDGATWSNLGNGVRTMNNGGVENGAVRSLAVVGQYLYVGGTFKLAGNINATNIARWDGTNWLSVRQGASGTVQTLVANGSDLYAGGGFVFMDGLYVRAVARWDGTNWSALGGGFLPGGPIAGACNGSELFLGGTFPTVGGKASTNIAMWHIPYTLNIARSGNSDVLSWPAPGTNFVVQSATSLAASDWSDLPQVPVVVNDSCVVTNVASDPSRVYRLRRR
jgi:hypothetical protein